MTTTRPTHEVFNQVPDLVGRNFYAMDSTLQKAVNAFGGGWGRAMLSDYGALVGGELAEQGRLANRYPPEIRTHDRNGRRLDVVEFHPAYHQLMGTAIAHGVHSLPWEAPRAGAQVVRAALEHLHNQADSGTDCPLTMTYASVPALRINEALAAAWEPQILSRVYDSSNVPHSRKSGVTLGMAMTEKQGGTDVRANSSVAVPLNAKVSGGECAELTGHKWFCSAPMSDAFLTLAKLEGRLTCFLMPRWKPDGSRNSVHLQRLKDKLGNRSNASSEIEFDGAFAWLVGEPGRGVATIMRMVALTRFSCMVGSGAIMRHALIQVLNHIRYRSVAGSKLIDHPLMRNVAADLALETEAALWLTFRVAAALDNRRNDPREELFVRLATAVGKYWICKRAPQHINEAQECLGGLGYVEEHVLPRLYREAPVNSIWEGSGNVQCLDLLGAIANSAESADVLLAELSAVRGSYPVYDRALRELAGWLTGDVADAFKARTITERIALLLQASLLSRYSSDKVTHAFIESRLGGPSLAYGGLRDPAVTDELLSVVELD